MTTKEINFVTKLAKQAEKASKLVLRNRLLIETYLSVAEMKAGKVTSHKSVNSLFKKLGV
jgi:hypothetical protein